jgi:uncharacterized membrane protein (UPF0127 family)
MLALTLFALLLPAASDGVHAESGLPTTRLLLAGHPVRAEVADDDAARSRGLMFRKSLPLDEGMLFVFDAELPLSFWMKNTLIPLDMLYFDRDGRLVSVQRDVPPCRTAYCPSFPGEAPARYVLELNAGRARQLDLPRGARLCERAPQHTPLPACAEP